jgi:demethylmenaquinone methyltransferase/2-methoxy-6-polyprenyl-1,4-benzoquinol methylase
VRAWSYFDPDYVRRRFNRLAPVYTLLDWVGLPIGMRAATVRALQLKPGARVLEVGCGTGRNFPLLLDTIGPSGQLYGIDFAEEMLKRAEALCRERGWRNVTLLQGDATGYTLPEPMDAALFSLSYATMARHRDALRHAWRQLRPGGRLAVMDAKTPPGACGKLVGPLLFWISRASVLGNPDARPWEHLRELTPHVDLQEKALGTYYICCGTKLAAPAAAPPPE